MLRIEFALFQCVNKLMGLLCIETIELNCVHELKYQQLIDYIEASRYANDKSLELFSLKQKVCLFTSVAQEI